MLRQKVRPNRSNPFYSAISIVSCGWGLASSHARGIVFLVHYLHLVVGNLLGAEENIIFLIKHFCRTRKNSPRGSVSGGKGQVCNTHNKQTSINTELSSPALDGPAMHNTYDQQFGRTRNADSTWGWCLVSFRWPSPRKRGDDYLSEDITLTDWIV